MNSRIDVSRSIGNRHKQFLNGASRTALLALSTTLVLGVVLPRGAQAGAVTVNPVQSTQYSLTTGNNPITFGSGTKIQTTGSVPAVYGSTAAPWTITNLGIIQSGNSGIVLGSSSTVTNAGTISTSSFSAVQMNGGGAFTNQSGGTINGSIAVNSVSLDTVTNLSGGIINGTVIARAGAAGATITNAGNINPGTLWGTSFYLSGGGTGTLNNQSGGRINGGVNIYGAVGSVTNAGIIGAPGGATPFGLYLQQGGNVTNSGTISTSSIGIGLGGGSKPGGSSTVGGPGTVTNSGTITVTGSYGVGVRLANSGTVTNSGSITASGSNSYGVQFIKIGGGSGGSGGGGGGGGGANVYNLAGGTITGTTGVGIYGRVGTVTNAGTIKSTSSGIYISGAAGTVTNSGTISNTGLGVGVGLANGGSIINQATGTINAGSTSTVVPTNATNVGGYGVGGNGVSVTNAGSIFGFSAGVRFGSTGTSSLNNQVGGSVQGDVGVLSTGPAVTVANAGSITGLPAVALPASLSGMIPATYLPKYGSLFGGVGEALLFGGTVTNTGSITGTSLGVFTTTNSATVTNSGTISGSVASVEFNGTGANTLTLQTGSTLSGNAIGSTAKGATNALVLQGTGTANNNFLNFTTLSVNPSNNPTSGAWALGGVSTIGTTTVSSGSLNVTGTLTSAFTTISGATLQIGNGGATGSITGNVTNNGTIAFNRAGTNTFGGIVSGTGSLTQVGSGTTVLTGTNTYTGSTTITAGTLQIGNGGTAGSIAGSIVDNGTLVVALSNSYTVAGAFSGSGTLIDQDPGVLTFSGAYNFTGTTAVTGGGSINITQLQQNAALNVSSGTVNIAGGATTIASLNGTGGTVNIASGNTLTVTSGTFGGTITGAGSLTIAGTGTLTLTGTDVLTGTTTVSSGTLNVNGSLTSPVSVGNGGTLGGTGTITGQVTVASGGTFSPGDPVTSSVIGGVTFTKGSIYLPQQTSSASDLIAVTGTATIQSGASVVSMPLGSATGYSRFTSYTILTATQGVTGTFSSVSSTAPTLSPYLSYSSNSVTLDLVRNDINLNTLASTTNQTAVATAINSAGPSSAIYAAVAPNSDPVVKQSFDTVSGEVHATVASALLNDSDFLADAVQSRGPSSNNTNIWANENSRWSNFNGNTNAASANGNLWGFGAGADTAVDDGVRVGAAIGHSQDKINVAARSSYANVSTTYAGAYAALTSGALSFTTVLSYGWHKIGTLREISFGSFNSNATADYDGNTTNVFGELRYREDFDGYFAEPFAKISGSKLRTAAFSESAGTAALNGASASRDIIFTTLGSRFGTTYDLPRGGTLSPLVSLGWEHGSNSLTPTENLDFASGGSAFTVAGVPLARDSFATDAGFKLGLSDVVNVNLFYEGRVSGTLTENSVNASLDLGL